MQMEINLAISGENGIASSKTEITRGKLASILAKFGDERKRKKRERKGTGGRKNSIVGSERNRDSVSPYFTSSLEKSTSCETDSIDRGYSALVDRFDSLFVERTH